MWEECRWRLGPELDWRVSGAALESNFKPNFNDSASHSFNAHSPEPAHKKRLVIAEVSATCLLMDSSITPKSRERSRERT